MLRERKTKRYNEQTNDDDDGRKYNIKEKVRSERFEQLRDLQELSGDAITIKMIQRQGFDKPILVRDQDGLDLRVPSKTFVVRDVGKLVGYDRIIDVVDVRTQKNVEMTMRDWCKYYESKNRHKLLNVISLEFSHTDLDQLVESPRIVRQLDWVDLIWPKFLKESQTESTNTIDKMKYPKVQKYCLMSVRGSYTDFHIDFGGTSVWYHIIRGKKIFWMAPPTELNLQTFEEWTLSGLQQDVFFGDTVEECFRVELTAGDTFFIPSGWIHAVYTSEDSLVFGGNFLHSFGIENQLKVARIEDATKVPIKFRYPFYTEMLWYVVQHYVYCLTGRSHFHCSAKTTPEKKTQDNQKANPIKSKQIDQGSTTESDHDESDIKKRNLQQVKRKRGRPTKVNSNKKVLHQTLSDDDSTEIDSEYEETKPAKSTATCRMTKNSLLRLQYEVEDFSATCQQSNPPRTNPSSKKSDRVQNNTVKPKDRPSKKQGNNSNDNESPSKEPSCPTSESKLDSSSSMVLKQDPAKINGWSNPTVGNQTIWSNRDLEPKEPQKLHITKNEVNGLRVLVKYLSKLSGTKKNMPSLIRNSRALLDDCKKVIAEHENDDPELAVTGIIVGPELLNPKKSEINQLIEQFFKPSETNTNDDSAVGLSPKTSRSKVELATSSSIYLNNRLKRCSNTLDAEEDDKSATISPKNSPHKDRKNSSSNKRLPTTTSSSSTTNETNTEPRPKSPPTRPLSNKQYTSKNKNDASLVLPGSFADLIAATSTAKEVFEVSSVDVTSSLFGLKPTSPSKSNTNIKEKDQIQSNLNNSPKSTPTIKTQVSQTSNNPIQQTRESVGNITFKTEHTAKAHSPEPPRMSPPKRFINPAYKPQVKEKLIFASAPYMSSTSASEQSTPHNLYPWLSPATQPSPDQTQSQKPSHSTLTLANQPKKPENFGYQTKSSVKDTPPSDLSTKPIETTKFEPPKSCDDPQDKFAQTMEVSTAQVKDPRKAKSSPPIDPVSHKKSEQAVIHRETVISTIQPTMKLTPVQNPCDTTIEKPHKPRGPPKKSKEARQVLETCTSEPSPLPSSTSIINESKPTTPIAPPPLPVQTATTSKPTSSLMKPITDVGKAKDKSKAKRQGKKHQDGSATIDRSRNIHANIDQQPRAPLICAISSASTITPGPTQTSSQQYLISRPLLFNSMPTFSTTGHVQHLPRNPMPLLATSVPTPLTMQPGARIVWATRPREAPPVTAGGPTNMSIKPAPSSEHSKSRAPRYGLIKGPTSTTTTNETSRQPDNAALLSLATTALSTASLPTTPTMSNITARMPTATQALMVNPGLIGQSALFAGQQFYNPYLQQMPLIQFASRGTTPIAPMTTVPRSTAPLSTPRPTSQLLFAPLSNQLGAQQRFLIAPPGFMQQRSQMPQLFNSHLPSSSLAFATYRPPTADGSKAKKVKTR